MTNRNREAGDQPTTWFCGRRRPTNVSGGAGSEGALASAVGQSTAIDRAGGSADERSLAVGRPWRSDIGVWCYN